MLNQFPYQQNLDVVSLEEIQGLLYLYSLIHF